MALTGSATQEDGGKLPMQEITAVLKLLGMFLTAMSPLLLLPLFAADAQGRRWVEGRTGLCIFGVGVSTILTFLIAVNWDLVAPYAETSFVGLHSVFNVAKKVPGELVDWLQSGEGFYLLLKVFATLAVISLFSVRVLPILQKWLSSLKRRIKGRDINLEPRSVNREEIAASRERQQEELQEKARERDELLRQRRLARVAEEEQRMSQRFARGVGRYAR
ncbi:hypothetical protein KC19_7G169700 [Ceratodon purpureus]|uniref:Uncharacterized protein n=1 Tax=Ceratodon purpureus TaxID=3225 RepID=A0A8T0H7I8_CERPU|nr:hypothetical protein KC19_7G169700 [Ceratodon purpureus]